MQDETTPQTFPSLAPRGEGKSTAEGREQKRGGSGAGEQAQGFTDKPPARAPEGELARRLPSRRGCPKRRVLKGRSRLYAPVVDPEEL